MEDFFAAGGIGAVLRELKPLLNLDCLTITGETLRERLAAEEGEYVDRRVIKSAKEPLEPQGGLVALFGSLAPDGAIIKRSAATPSLFEKTGRAVVFSSLDDLGARIDDPKLDVTADDFLILQNAGPKSASAMPEAGFLPIPKKLLEAGVKDMVRMSDARMSGTAYGTISWTSRRKPPSAGRWGWCAPATGSSCPSRTARSICWWTMPNSPSAAP